MLRCHSYLQPSIPVEFPTATRSAAAPREPSPSRSRIQGYRPPPAFSLPLALLVSTTARLTVVAVQGPTHAKRFAQTARPECSYAFLKNKRMCPSHKKLAKRLPAVLGWTATVELEVEIDQVLSGCELFFAFDVIPLDAAEVGVKDRLALLQVQPQPENRPPCVIGTPSAPASGTSEAQFV